MVAYFKYLLAGIALTIAALTAFAAPAAAQASRTWVSGVGDDANPCSRTAPCKTFAGAISKTATGGEIDCLDPGGYGAVTITKSITIDCSGVTGGILGAGTNSVVVNAAVDSVVVLRGISIHGFASGLNGVRFVAGATLILDDCEIRFSQGANPNGFGISFQPSGASQLIVNNSRINSNGTGATGGGILVQPTGTGSARVMISNSELIANAGVGIKLSTSGNTGTLGIRLMMTNTNISGSPAGLSLVGSTGSIPVEAMVRDSSLFNNSLFGIIALGANSLVRVSDTAITGNSVAVSAVSGGQILSYGDNLIDGNPNASSFTGNATKR